MVQKDYRSVHSSTTYDAVREAASVVSIPQPRTPRAPKPSDIVNPTASPTKVFRHLEDHTVSAPPIAFVGASKVPDHRDDVGRAGNGTDNVLAGEFHVTDLRKPVIGGPTDDVFAGASKVPDHRKNPVGADNGIDTGKVSSPHYEGTDETHITSAVPEAPTVPSSQNEHTGALITSCPAALGFNKTEYVKPSPNIQAKGFESHHKSTQASEGNVHQEPPGKKEGNCSCSVC